MMLSEMNRVYNSSNPFQGTYKKVLCVCSAGLLRSPTAAWVLSNDPYNFNTRAAGIEESYALIPVDVVLLTWADEVVCMTEQHKQMLEAKFAELPPIVVLNIPDDYRFKDPKLVDLIRERYK